MFKPEMAPTIGVKASKALKALKAMQEEAKRKGLDKISMNEINREIETYRGEKRLKPIPKRNIR